VAEQYMSELVCKGCGHTAHITWEGTGDAKRPVNMSTLIKENPGPPPTFTFLKCGTAEQPV
jgi:hypothetical protein